MEKSLSDLREFALGKKGEHETVFGYYFLRRISPIFTWVFLRLGVSANLVTGLALVTALAGSFMFLSTSIIYWFAGWLLYQLYYILDCSDGEIAVLTDTTSDFGAFLDKISHPITNSAIIYLAAFGAYRMTGNLPLLVFSASGAIMFNLTSVMRYFVQEKTSSEDGEDIKNIQERSIGVRAFKLAKNLAIKPGGITHPLLAFLILDAVTGSTWRVFYPAAASLMAIVMVLKRFYTVRGSMQ